MTSKIKCECGKWIDVSDQLDADLQLIADAQAAEIEQLRSSAAGSLLDDYREAARLLASYGIRKPTTLAYRLKAALDELDNLKAFIRERNWRTNDQQHPPWIRAPDNRGVSGPTR